MSAHRTLKDLFKAFTPDIGPGLLPDPGSAGTITVDKWGQICEVNTTPGGARTLAAPTRAGILGAVVLGTDAGDLTLTVNPASGTVYGYNTNLDTTIVFTAAGNFAVFYSIKVGTEYAWRLLREEGTDATAESLSLADGDLLSFGTGTDVQVQWDGTRLVGASAANAMWDNCPSPMDPNYKSTVFEFFDDFTEYDGTATVGGWLLASAGGAGGTAALVNTVAGGQIVITCATTDDDDGNQISQVSAPFYLAAGKHLWFEVRFKVKSTAAGNGLTQSDYYLGLASLNEDLSAVADNFAADGVLFTKVDGDVGTFDFTASKGGTNTGTSASMATVVEDTWMTLGFYVNGVTNITPYVDGVAGTAIAATLPDDTSQGVILGCRNGDATETITLTVDYVKVVQLR